MTTAGERGSNAVTCGCGLVCGSLLFANQISMVMYKMNIGMLSELPTYTYDAQQNSETEVSKNRLKTRNEYILTTVQVEVVCEPSICSRFLSLSLISLSSLSCLAERPSVIHEQHRTEAPARTHTHLADGPSIIQEQHRTDLVKAGEVEVSNLPRGVVGREAIGE